MTSRHREAVIADPWPYGSMRGQIALLAVGNSCGLVLAAFFSAWVALAVAVCGVALIAFAKLLVRWQTRPYPRAEALSPEELAWWSGRLTDRDRQTLARCLGVLGAAAAINLWQMGAIAAWSIHFAFSSGIPWLKVFLVPLMVGMTVGILQAMALARQGVRRPPLSPAAQIFKWILPARTYDRCVEPFLADHQAEYFEALHLGQVHRAQWLVALSYLILATQLARLVILGIARLLNPRAGS
jgi:hypothetical protein